MNDTAFEKLEAAAAVLKLDFSSEEFASFLCCLAGFRKNVPLRSFSFP